MISWIVRLKSTVLDNNFQLYLKPLYLSRFLFNRQKPTNYESDGTNDQILLRKKMITRIYCPYKRMKRLMSRAKISSKYFTSESDFCIITEIFNLHMKYLVLDLTCRLVSGSLQACVQFWHGRDCQFVVTLIPELVITLRLALILQALMLQALEAKTSAMEMYIS